MSCSDFERELEQLVETGAGSLSETASSHATECADCRRHWREHCLLDAALKVWRPVTVPSELADKVLGQLLLERSPVPAHTDATPRARWGVVAVAAACLVVIVGLGIVSSPGPIDRDQSLAGKLRSGPGSDLPSPTQASVELASSVAAVFDDLRLEYREMAAETRATAREFAVAIPAPSVASWSDSVSAEVLTGTPGDSGSGADAAAPSSVSVIGRSIGTQIGQAMDFLWVTVPDGVPRG